MEHRRLELKEQFDFLSENGKNPFLDIYLPYNSAEMGRQKQKRPCMLILPGGGYGMCSEREAEPVSFEFLSEGFNCFVLNYSVAPHRFPTQLIEVAAAMELIYKNSEMWGCDTSKIAIIGFSAGGHLAAHYSVAYDCDEVRAAFPESKNVNATILSYPVISADSRFSHQGSFINLLGHEPQNDDEIRLFSPDLLVKNTTPPAFVWHTAQDSCVPVANSLMYTAALCKRNVPAELHIYPFGDHGMSICNETVLDDVSEIARYNSEWVSSAKKWLKLIFAQ